MRWSREAGSCGDSFFVAGPDLLDQRTDFFRRQFGGELGHVPFSVGDYAAQVFRRSSSGFLGDERWAGKMAALGSLSVTFGAVALIRGVRGQAGVGGGNFGEGRREREEPGTGSDSERASFQVGPQ